MALFDNLKERATDLAQSGAAKAKQLAEIAKLKTSNLAEEDAIKKAYIEIGKLYYAEKGDAPEAAYVSACEKVSRAKANIAANKARLAELRSDGAPDQEDEPDDGLDEDCSCCCGESQTDETTAEPKEDEGCCGCSDDQEEE